MGGRKEKEERGGFNEYENEEHDDKGEDGSEEEENKGKQKRHRRGDNFIAQNYKTEICQSHKNLGRCEYEDNCQFAHGIHELRPRHYGLKYKTQKCINYHTEGYCRFGSRCKFIHDERRLQVKEDEFWLVSPSENLIRIEVVDNELRKEELQALVQQDGSDDLVELFKQVSLEPGKDDEVKWRGGSYYQGEHKTAKLQPGPYYLPHSAAMQHELYGMMPYYQPPMMSYAPPTGMALPQGSMMYPTAPSHPLSLAPPSNGMYPINPLSMPMGVGMPLNHQQHVPINQQHTPYYGVEGYSNGYGAPYHALPPSTERSGGDCGVNGIPAARHAPPGANGGQEMNAAGHMPGLLPVAA